MGPRSQPKRVGDREKLLAGAMLCLQQKGYAGTTARDLVAASGANLASIGYHFGGKEALLNEAVARGVVLWTQSIEAEAFAGQEGSSRERLRAALGAMIDRFDELEPYLVSFVEAFPPAVRSQQLRATMAAAYEESRLSGGATLRDALQADGTDVSQREGELLATVLLALCDGLILQWLLDRDRAPSSGEVISALRTLGSALSP